MGMSKELTVRRVVGTLLAAVVLLIPLSLLLNRVSLNTDGYFNIAELLSHPLGGLAPEPTTDDATIAAVPSNGDGNFTNLVTEEFLEVADSTLTLDDVDATNATRSVIAPAPSTGNATVSGGIGNQTGPLQGNGDGLLGLDSGLPSNTTTQSEDSSSDTNVESPQSSSSPGADVAVVAPAASENSTSGLLDQSPIDRSQAKRQRVFQPASLPHYSFVKFSAYRQSLRTFYVMGITSFVARAFDEDTVAHTCEWHPANGSLPMAVHTAEESFVTTVAEHVYWKSDENKGTYNPITINCSFAQDVGADGMGGLLVLRISTGYDRWDKNLPVVAMEEQAGEVDVVLTPSDKLPFKYAFCGAPIHGKVRADWLLQWMTYHHYLADGSAHFFFYNMGGLDDADRPVFQRFWDAGKLSITDILDPNLGADYPTWYFHQVLLINDCLHRSRFMAERVFFIDYDEFVQIPAPDTLSKFFARHEKEPWISLASMYANSHDCRSARPGVSEAPVERMIWRRPTPECRPSAMNPKPNPWLCVGPPGRRKYVANPRKTFAAGVHWATFPEKGLNLVGTEAHLLHYRSAPLPKVRLCVNNVTLSEGKDSEERGVLAKGWIQDESTSNIYARAKVFPV